MVGVVTGVVVGVYCVGGEVTFFVGGVTERGVPL